MPVIPDSVKISLQQRLTDHAQRWWPDVAQVTMRYRGRYAYIDAQLTDGDALTLIRLGYTGSEDHWDLYAYRASTDTYAIGIAAGGDIDISGTPEHALDSACQNHLTDAFSPEQA